MGFWAFVGGFLAVAAALGGLYWVLRRKVRQFSRRTFGTPDLLGAFSKINAETEPAPRSLNGCDSILLPRILADFPDFDVTTAKTYARNALRENLKGKTGLEIYNIVLARYERAAVQKTIIFQAAVSYQASGQKQQKRYNLHYTYLVTGSTETIAANCPNCGGALPYGQTTCAYCGSRVANILGNTWKFTQIIES